MCNISSGTRLIKEQRLMAITVHVSFQVFFLLLDRIHEKKILLLLI